LDVNIDAWGAGGEFVLGYMYVFVLMLTFLLLLHDIDINKY